MITLLLIFVIVMDLLLLGLVYFMSKQKFNPIELLKEISNERKLLKEMREGIQFEIDSKYQKVEELYKKINAIAAEAEIEVKNTSETLSTDMAEVLDEFSQKLMVSGEQITRQKTSMGAIIQRASQERDLLKKVVSRAEKLSKFFRHELFRG